VQIDEVNKSRISIDNKKTNRTILMIRSLDNNVSKTDFGCFFNGVSVFYTLDTAKQVLCFPRRDGFIVF